MTYNCVKLPKLFSKAKINSRHPEPPASPELRVYADVTLSEFIPYRDIIENVPQQYRETHNKPVSMEMLDVNNGNGQSYGYIVYRKNLVLKSGMKLTIRGHPRDIVQVLVNGVQVSRIFSFTDIYILSLATFL